MILTFLLLCLVTLMLYGFLSILKPKNYPPGPPWLPFIGSSGILQLMSKKHGSEFRAFVELSKKYSTNIIGLKTSSELIVVVFGEKNVRQVFNDREFDARPHNFFAKLRCLGKKNIGITFANGQVWKEQRRFTMKNLKYVGYGKTLMEKEIQNQLCQILEHIKNNTSKPINLVDLLSESVINVLWNYVAGYKIPIKELRHLLDLFRQRGKAFSLAGGLLNQIPWCRFVIPELSGYTLITKINQEISKIIEEAIQKHKRNEVERSDFIYMFMQEMSAKRSSTFTEEQLKMVCLDLFIAGTQTSSNVLSFCLLKVLQSQDIQDKVFNEIITLIGDKMPCWNDSERLVYTSAFIQEVCRYYMIVPIAGPRVVEKDALIDGYLVPKGTTVLISLGDIYFDPKLWEDPYVFKPERFIDDSGMLINSDHLYTFGSGILQNYRLQCSNGTIPSDTPVIGLLSSPKPYMADFTSRTHQK